MDTFCFTYQHVDCLYTLFKYRFSGKIMQRVDKCLTKCNEQLTLITETKEWTECRALQKRDSWGKSTKSNSILFFRFILSYSFATFRWQPLCYNQCPAFSQKFQKKVSLFLQKPMKNSLFVETTASPITTTRRVFYPLVNIILYYLETLKNY